MAISPASGRAQIPPGTLEMLILRALQRDRELHGFGIVEAIDQGTGGVLFVEEGSLYPALQRMLVKGWLVGEWRRTPENRRARYYQLTAQGRAHLATEIAAWRRVSGAIAALLAPA